MCLYRRLYLMRSAVYDRREAQHKVTLFLKATVFAALLSLAVPIAEALEPVRTYRACVELVAKDPVQAYEAAEEWQNSRGKPGAAHCLALALVAQGEFARAARRLEAIASMQLPLRPLDDEWILTEARRVDLLAQAGNAWLLADNPEGAHALFSDALTKTTISGRVRGELLVDRARALALLDDLKSAIGDLDGAMIFLGERADILTFRASAQRQLGLLAEAKRDVERALELDPSHADALFERGNVRYDMGDRDGARADWARVTALAPGTLTAEAAERNKRAVDGQAEVTPPKPSTQPEPQDQAPVPDATGEAEALPAGPSEPAPTRP